MEKTLAVLSSFLLFIFMIALVNDYPFLVLVCSAAALSIVLIVYLFRFKGKYISWDVIAIHVISLIIQIVIAIIYKDMIVSNGYMGLGGGSIGLVFYLFLFAIFTSLLLIVNIIKFILKKLLNKKDN